MQVLERDFVSHPEEVNLVLGSMVEHRWSFFEALARELWRRHLVPLRNRQCQSEKQIKQLPSLEGSCFIGLSVMTYKSLDSAIQTADVNPDQFSGFIIVTITDDSPKDANSKQGRYRWVAAEHLAFKVENFELNCKCIII